MTRRIVVETDCEHGEWFGHNYEWPFNVASNANDVIAKWCTGGTRTVFEGVPDELVERGAEGIKNELMRYFGIPADEPSWAEPSYRQRAAARAVLEAVFEESP